MTPDPRVAANGAVLADLERRITELAAAGDDALAAAWAQVASDFAWNSPCGVHASPAIDDAIGLRRPLARLGMGLHRRHRQPQGDDIDIDAAVEAHVEMMAGSVPDEAVYLDSLRRHRDLSVLLLLDISGSTAEAGTSLAQGLPRRLVKTARTNRVPVSATTLARGPGPWSAPVLIGATGGWTAEPFREAATPTVGSAVTVMGPPGLVSAWCS